jgi:hypothetical protein
MLPSAILTPDNDLTKPIWQQVQRMHDVDEAEEV